MTEKEMKRLSRIELLEIIHMLQKSERRLMEENRALKQKLQERKELLEQSGTFHDMSAALDEAVRRLQTVVYQYQLALENEGVALVSALHESDDSQL